MGLALTGVVILFLLVMGAAVVMLTSLNKAPKRGARPLKKEIKKKVSQPTYRHIGDLMDMEAPEPGVVYAGGKYLAYARVEGANFSILSDGEKDIREDVLIGLQNQIKYPQQFVTSTVVIDTEHAAMEVRDQATRTENPHLAQYSLAYAGELEEMKRQRQAMAQVTWLVISDDGESGDPAQSLREKLALLRELFTRSGLILTPLASTEEIIDAMQQIMLPEHLTPASETAVFGLNPVKFNIKELENLV
jgi:hypothetical protein